MTGVQTCALPISSTDRTCQQRLKNLLIEIPRESRALSPMLQSTCMSPNGDDLITRPRSGPSLPSQRPRSCERGGAGAPGQELGAGLGVGVRRGSTSVIDTLRGTHMAHLHTLFQSQQSEPVSPTSTPTDDQSDTTSASEGYSEAEDGFPSHSAAFPPLPLSPPSLATVCRRHSDSSMEQSSEIGRASCRERVSSPV